MSIQTISYAARGPATLDADLYRPESGDSWPLLVAVHGGAWRHGARDQMRQWGEYFAANGIAVLAIDYRKSGAEASWPGNAEDVRDAWSFAHAHAAEWGVDPDRIGFLGASAGAHLVALATVTGTPARVLILAYGVYDLTTHWTADQGRADPGEDPTERMTGCTPADNPELYAAASPLQQLGDATGIRALLVWGDADETVLPRQSQDFAAALGNAGATVETLPVAGAGHFWFSRDSIDDQSGVTHAVAPRLLDFARRAFA